MTNEQQQAVATVPAKVLTDASAVNSAVVDLSRSGYNVLGPKVQSLAPGWGFAFSAIRLNPDDKRECYCDPKTMTAGERALTKNALDQIAALAGINWRTMTVEHIGNDPLHVRVTVGGDYRDAQGEIRPVQALRVTDLREGGMDAKGMSPKQLEQARRFIEPMTESKAKNRAIRQAFGLKQKYSAAELKRPIVVLRPVAMPDTSDPVIRRMVAARALGMTEQLYGSGAPRVSERPRLELVSGEDDDAEPRLPEFVSDEQDDAEPPLHNDTAEAPTPADDGDSLYTVTGVMQLGADQWVATAKELPPGHHFVTDDAGVAVSLRSAQLTNGRRRLALEFEGAGPALRLIEIVSSVDTETEEVV